MTDRTTDAAASGLRIAVRVERGAFVLDARVDVEPGRVLALLGPNGAGKSTVLGCVAGTVAYDGSVELAGRRLDELPVERRGVGLVFQDHLLFPHLSVLENVAFGPRARRAPDPLGTARAWLDRVGLAEHADAAPRRLSGGQQQRVALARALAVEPGVLLLDEPLAALDVEVRASVRAWLREHLVAFAGPSIVVTHSTADVEALADDVAVIEAGRVVQSGPVAEVLAEPATEWMRALIAARA